MFNWLTKKNQNLLGDVKVKILNATVKMGLEGNKNKLLKLKIYKTGSGVTFLCLVRRTGEIKSVGFELF